jgi:hypothetical protein
LSRSEKERLRPGSSRYFARCKNISKKSSFLNNNRTNYGNEKIFTVTAYFSYGQYTLGTVHAESDYTGSNFDLAGAWIK